MTYLIEFRFPGDKGEPDAVMYAAKMRDNALGFAYLPATALEFELESDAERMLAFGYGEASREVGKVISV
jgi:hypothetical protein